MENIFELSPYAWVLLMLAAFSVGAAKNGIVGLSLFFIPFLAAEFGGIISSGLMLPILSMADVSAVKNYHRDARFSLLFRVLPAALIGLGLGLYFGAKVNDLLFKRIIAVCILLSAGIMSFQSQAKTISRFFHFPAGQWLLGLAGGFATMVGNSAGPIMWIYFFSLGLDKKTFVGTAAWFFFIINLVKIPLHIFFWQSINWSSFSLNLFALPAIILGAWAGKRFLQVLPEKYFKPWIIVASVLAATKILIWP